MKKAYKIWCLSTAIAASICLCPLQRGECGCPAPASTEPVQSIPERPDTTVPDSAKPVPFDGASKSEKKELGLEDYREALKKAETDKERHQAKLDKLNNEFNDLKKQMEGEHKVFKDAEKDYNEKFKEADLTDAQLMKKVRLKVDAEFEKKYGEAAKKMTKEKREEGQKVMKEMKAEAVAEAAKAEAIFKEKKRAYESLEKEAKRLEIYVEQQKDIIKHDDKIIADIGKKISEGEKKDMDALEKWIAEQEGKGKKEGK